MLTIYFNIMLCNQFCIKVNVIILRFKLLVMKVTLRNKDVQKQNMLKNAHHWKFIDQQTFSKQIKQLVLVSKNITAKPSKNRQQSYNAKLSLQTTASSFSTRPHSAQKHKKICVVNPEADTVLREHILDLNKSKNNVYSIKWRSSNSNISKSMRVVLGIWLMELSHQLQIPKDALFNAMHYTDKYASMVQITRSKYQSVGLCALFIASKLELSNHPNINSFLEAMDNSMSKKQLIDLQQSMVLKLKFRLNPPTLYQYMVLQVSLFNYFVGKNNLGGSQIVAGSVLHRSLFWMLDGVHLDNQYKQFSSKQKICLSLMYIALKKQKTAKSVHARKKLIEQLETLKQYGETERIFQNFLTNVIQVIRKLSELKECIKHYANWAKVQCPSTATTDGTIESQLELLKKVVMTQ